MSILSGVFVYVLLWWLFFFLSLPFGLEVPEKATLGVANSAPEKTFLAWKVLFASVAAFLGTLVYVLLRFRGLAWSSFL